MIRWIENIGILCLLAIGLGIATIKREIPLFEVDLIDE